LQARPKSTLAIAVAHLLMCTISLALIWQGWLGLGGHGQRNGEQRAASGE
jgi:hypothetical protein